MAVPIPSSVFGLGCGLLAGHRQRNNSHHDEGNNALHHGFHLSSVRKELTGISIMPSRTPTSIHQMPPSGPLFHPFHPDPFHPERFGRPTQGLALLVPGTGKPKSG